MLLVAKFAVMGNVSKLGIALMQPFIYRIALLLYAGWFVLPVQAQSATGLISNRSLVQSVEKTPRKPGTKVGKKPAPTIMNFRCDGRQYCSQMTSQAEAEYFLQHCPDTRIDGDYDGIPCENDSRF
ncbi:MAG: hypothetical protein ACI9C4_000654 [Paraglaciecola sp.]|jgi:hypothetical protein